VLRRRVAVAAALHRRVQLGNLAEAKAAYVRTIDAWQAPSAWLGLGIATLRLGELAEASDMLLLHAWPMCDAMFVVGSR